MFSAALTLRQILHRETKGIRLAFSFSFSAKRRLLLLAEEAEESISPDGSETNPVRLDKSAIFSLHNIIFYFSRVCLQQHIQTKRQIRRDRLDMRTESLPVQQLR